MHLLIRDHAAAAGFSLEGPVSEICRLAGVNRQQAYEKREQLIRVLEKVDLPGPGRAPIKREATSGRDTAEWDLQVTLLRYRLDNPGAFVPRSGGHNGYSSAFIRTVLDLLDDWTGALERFCELAEVPYQTLDAWKKKDADQPYVPAPV